MYHEQNKRLTITLLTAGVEAVPGICLSPTPADSLLSKWFILCEKGYICKIMDTIKNHTCKFCTQAIKYTRSSTCLLSNWNYDQTLTKKPSQNVVHTLFTRISWGRHCTYTLRRDHPLCMRVNCTSTHKGYCSVVNRCCPQVIKWKSGYLYMVIGAPWKCHVMLGATSSNRYKC